MPDRSKLLKMMKELDLEITATIVNDESLSDVVLATRMIYQLVAAGKQNEEVCKWAAETTADIGMFIASEVLQDMISTIKARLAKGETPAEIGLAMRENAKEVYAAYTDHFVRAIAHQLLASTPEA